MKFFWFFFLSFSINLFSQPVTKQDFQTLREDIREQNRILREDMNKRFEMMQEQNRILREDINDRFQIIFWVIGILQGIAILILIYVLRQLRKSETQKYDIAYLEEQIYRARPEVKARIYFHIKEEAEKYKEKTSV